MTRKATRFKAEVIRRLEKILLEIEKPGREVDLRSKISSVLYIMNWKCYIISKAKQRNISDEEREGESGGGGIGARDEGLEMIWDKIIMKTRA